MSLVSIINNYPKFQLLSPAIKSIIETVAKGENISFSRVTIIAAGDPILNRLKKQYFHDDVLTDTISFNFNEPGEAIEGEIYISIDRIKDNARRFENTFQQELILVILHSILHLIGYNDQHPDEKQQMEQLQQRYLHQIHVKRLFRVLKNNTTMSDNSTLCNEFAKLIEIVRTLRGPSGCEWDRAQTALSLSPYFLEEAHETIEAIHENDHQKLKEELGDLLLHIVFQSEIAEEKNQFCLSDSIRNINEKLVRRHPHVYGDVNVKNVQAIKQNWEEIKLKEGRNSLMEGLPKTLPALLLARRIQERAAEVGFDWDKIDLVWEKVHEELDELKDALKLSDDKNITLEFGDLLFSLVNLSRFLNINPEEALYSTSKKFVRRFQYIEKELAAKNIQLKDATLEEMDRLWNQTRTKDNTSPS